MENTNSRKSNITWEVLYTDGSCFKEIDDQGNKHAYRNIDRTRVKEFLLTDQNGKQVLRITLDSDYNWIWSRRIEMLENQEVKETGHLVAKQKIVDGVIVSQNVVVVLESDGTKIISDSFINDHEWLYPKNIHEDEGEYWIYPPVEEDQTPELGEPDGDNI